MSGTVQRSLWNMEVSFRISEESLGVNETIENTCGIFKSEILFFQRRNQTRNKLEDGDGY